jgi:hypothetical protein
MKITRKIVNLRIDLDYSECMQMLNEYHANALQDLITYESDKNQKPGQCDYGRNLFILELLKHTESSDWFQNLIDKHGIFWISLIGGRLRDTVEQYPYLFGYGEEIHLAFDDNDIDPNNFEVWLDGAKLNSNIIMGQL